MKIGKLTSMMSVCLIAAMAATASADTIRLKNGTLIKGKVTGYSNGSFSVVIELGANSTSRATLDMRDVESIEFDGASEPAPSAASPRSTEPTRPSEPDDIDDRPLPARPAPERPAPPAAPSSSSTQSRPPGPELPDARPPSGDLKETVVAVGARDDWTYSNILVRKGDRISLSATGKVKLSATRDSGPEGVNIDDKNKLLLDRPTGALIAVIGDDNDDFIYVGKESEFTASRDGKLFLSVNEGDLTDNEGVFSVRVRIEPGR